MGKKTKGQEFISVIDKDKAIVKYLWRVVILLSISLVALSFAFMSIKNTVKVKVELPAKFIYKEAPVVVSGVDGSNKVYYKLWGNYIIGELANFSYEDIDAKVNLLIKMMRPTRFAEKKEQIDTFAKNLSTNLISQNYIIKDSNITKIKMSPNGNIQSASIVTKGMANQTIGRNYNNKECKYTVNLKYIRGVLYVEDFGTDCF